MQKDRLNPPIKLYELRYNSRKHSFSSSLHTVDLFQIKRTSIKWCNSNQLKHNPPSKHKTHNASIHNIFQKIHIVYDIQ